MLSFFYITFRKLNKYKPMIKSFLLLLLFFIASFAIAQKGRLLGITMHYWMCRTWKVVLHCSHQSLSGRQLYRIPFLQALNTLVKWLRVGEGTELHLHTGSTTTLKLIDRLSYWQKVKVGHNRFMVISTELHWQEALM